MSREEWTVNKIRHQDNALTEFPKSKQNAFIKTSTGVTTLLAASDVDRFVVGFVHVTTTFAAGDGAAPTVKIGQTGTDNKFLLVGSVSNALVAGVRVAVSGLLTAGTALISTAGAATGTTSAGAYSVDLIVV